MKYLVTGANGFLGRYIAEQLLSRGDTVRAMVRAEDTELRKQGAEIFIADVRDKVAVNRAVEQQEVVFHVASIAGIWGRWRRYYETNTLGAQNVLEACHANGTRALVYTSTPSVIFDGRDQCGVREDEPYPEHWLCHYPHSKKLAEESILAANRAEGLRTCALRPHLIWGPRDGHLIPRLFERARSGRLRRVGNGENMIDMVYVENAAEAHLQAADALIASAAPSGLAYSISQGEPVNCWQWIDELLALKGISPVRKTLSVTAAWQIGRAFEMLYAALRFASEPPMTRFLAAQLGLSHYFDITRARDLLEYAPRVSKEEGMRRLAESLRASEPGRV